MNSKNNMINKIGWIAFSFVLTACTTEDVIDIPEKGGNILKLSASRIQVTTKAPANPELFAEGTKYCIYAMNEGSTDLKNGSFTSWGNNPKTCVEISEHIINYGTPIALGINEVDFYGLTFGTKEDIIETQQLVTSATNRIVVTTAEQKDVMFSNHLKKCNSSQGALQLKFKHAKSKLLFKIYKAEEEGLSLSDRYFENTVLSKITIITTEKAEFNVFDNTWSNWQNKIELTSFNNKQKLTTQATPVPGETLIIPNSKTDPIQVKITLDKVRDKESNKEISKTLTYTIKNKKGEYIQIEPNQQYIFNIGILREKGNIVIAFDPMVVPWENVNIDLGDTSLPRQNN